MTKISDEDLDAWRENPITQAVFKHLERTGEQAQEMWASVLKADAAPDPQKLLLLHTELKAKLAFIAEMLNLEPRDIERTTDAGN